MSSPPGTFINIGVGGASGTATNGVPTPIPPVVNDFLQTDGAGGDLWAPITQDQVQAGFSIALALNSGGAGPLELGATWTPTFNVTYSSGGSTAETIHDTDGGTASIQGSANPVQGPSTTYTKSAVNATEGVFVSATSAGGTSKNSNTITMTFEPRCWAGVGSAGATGLNGTTGALVGATGTLTGQLQTSRASTNSETPSNQCIYVSYPTSFGLGTFTDLNTGFTFSMNAPSTVTVVNANGVSLSYYLYQSTQSTLNTNFNVKVS